MNRKGAFSILRWVAILFIVIAALLVIFQLVRYSRIRSSFPPGMVIAGVPVGGIDSARAAERLVSIYTATPVELHYLDGVIHMKPSVVAFEMQMDSMLAAADLERMRQPFWSGFWEFLWNRLETPEPAPLRATFSEERLRAYLEEEIAQRYDQPAQAALPSQATLSFQPGVQGSELDIDRAVILIGDALRSPTARVVNLSYNRVNPPRPAFQNLEVLLKQIIDQAKFDGVSEVYVLDLQNGQEIHFAYQNGGILQPDLAFTAASTMKIPIMVSTFRRASEPTSAEITEMLELMIERSENDPADRLMERVIERNLGPLEVTKDLQALGLSNTFLAGYFYVGAPLLDRIITPANQRTDVATSPDPYNQTSPVDMGQLLEDIYQCAKKNGGTFGAVFPGEISQGECQQMVDYLALNKIQVLLQAGLPEGTRIAHKHGWLIENDGLMHMIGDAGIVYSPGGDYIVSVYLYNPVQIMWDQTNLMVAQMSNAIYNYFNLGN